jgi:hypothetical protein
LVDLRCSVVGLDEPSLHVLEVEHEPFAGEQPGPVGVEVAAGQQRGGVVGPFEAVRLLGEPGGGERAVERLLCNRCSEPASHV